MSRRETKQQKPHLQKRIVGGGQAGLWEPRQLECEDVLRAGGAASSAREVVSSSWREPGQLEGAGVLFEVSGWEEPGAAGQGCLSAEDGLPAAGSQGSCRCPAVELAGWPAGGCASAAQPRSGGGGGSGGSSSSSSSSSSSRRHHTCNYEWSITSRQTHPGAQELAPAKVAGHRFWMRAAGHRQPAQQLVPGGGGHGPGHRAAPVVPHQHQLLSRGRAGVEEGTSVIDHSRSCSAAPVVPHQHQLWVRASGGYKRGSVSV